MTATASYPHITDTPGEPARLERLPRIRVAMIVTDYVGRGWTAEEIVLHQPHLTLAEVHAALGYYHDHQLEMDREMAGERADAERSRSEASLTPLLARLRARKAPATT